MSRFRLGMVPDWGRCSNLVLTGDLGRSVDLVETARLCPEASYEPEQFPGITYRPGKGCALVFSSGKLTITGVKSGKGLAEFIATAGAALDLPLDAVSFTLVNSTCNFNLTPEDFTRATLWPDSTYDPEHYPHAIIRHTGPPKWTMIITKSGSAYVTGLRNLDALSHVGEWLKDRAVVPKGGQQ